MTVKKRKIRRVELTLSATSMYVALMLLNFRFRFRHSNKIICKNLYVATTNGE